MSEIDGLSHSPQETPEAARARSFGIVNTPQIKLGSAVSLSKAGHSWEGFVLSIDRLQPDIDLIVCWTSRPSAASAKDGYGLFKGSQLHSVGGDMWSVDPATVSG